MLTEKELSVLKLVQQGLKQIEISKKLKVTQPAVSGLYRNVLRKVRDAKEVLELAKKLGCKP